MVFAPQSRLQIDTREGPEEIATVVAIRICVASEDGSKVEEGLIEFIEDEGNRRVRAEGLFEGRVPEPSSYDSKEGVWNVPLGEVELRFDWIKAEGQTEVLVEAAAAKD